jgi:hypothetical protein
MQKLNPSPGLWGPSWKSERLGRLNGNPDVPSISRIVSMAPASKLVISWSWIRSLDGTIDAKSNCHLSTLLRLYTTGIGPCLLGISSVSIGTSLLSGSVTSVPQSPLRDSPLSSKLDWGLILLAIRRLIDASAGLGGLVAFCPLGRSPASAPALLVCTPAVGRFPFFLAGRPSGCEIE